MGGLALARGYRNQSDLTAETFVDSPLVGGATLYRTGDKARYRADGQIEYLGRLDNQVKVRGYRIELGEVEAALAEHQMVREAVASVARVGADENRLIAYVVCRDSGAVIADPTAELASRWQTVWDETYLNADDANGSFNTVGWNSSYTGEPIPQADMREWVDQTVARVLSFKPKRVLEIGCGTGLILLRVAESCAYYAATDFSNVAIRHVRREIDKTPEKYQNVALFERAATDLESIGGPFDLVVLNSVIQYFPSIEYLRTVLRHAIAMTVPTGAILIGDVRSRSLLPMMRSWVETQHAADKLPLGTLKARIEKQIAKEEELVVDSVFFGEFQPDISQVTVDLKRGTRINEVMQFRHDVTLRRAKARQVAEPEQWIDWIDDELSLVSLRERLIGQELDVVGISSIPNARLADPTGRGKC